MPTPNIDSLWIYDIDTKKDIKPFKTGDILYLQELPKRFTIRAQCSNTQSVKFTLNTKVVVENLQPFTCMGDTTPILDKDGYYSFHAVPYAAKNASGEAGIPWNIDITVKSSSVIKGINYFNENGFDLFNQIALDCNVKGMRSWQAMKPGTIPTARQFEHYKQYKDAGYKIVVVCTIPERSTHNQLPTRQQTINWFKEAARVAGKLVDGWEVGNEPNLANYWPGTLSEFMDLYQKPAYETLKALGHTVYGASIAENKKSFEDIIKLRYMDYCDVASYHPYNTNKEKHIAAVTYVKTLLGLKPLSLTEWNIHGYWNQPRLTAQQWADSLQVMAGGIRHLVTEAYYFQYSKNNSAAGVAGIMDSKLKKKIEPFYSAFRNLKF